MLARFNIPRMATPALALVLTGCTMIRGLEVGFPTAFQGRHGQEVVRRVCTACHAIDEAQVSPRPGAPAISRIAMKYSRTGLERELETIAEIGHYDMPALALSPKARRDVAVYITSLRRPEADR